MTPLAARGAPCPHVRRRYRFKQETIVPAALSVILCQFADMLIVHTVLLALGNNLYLEYVNALSICVFLA